MRRRKPRLMILGGGSSQISALRRGQQMGFDVILADQNPQAPGRRWADRFEEASTFDVEAVEAAAARSGAEALLAVGSDQPVYTAASVSRRLDLPYPLSPEQALRVTNKGEMKRILSSAEVPLVPWTLLSRDSSAWRREGLDELTPPWVVKPVDSQGQRGIRIVRNREELGAHLPVALSFSREERVLVEEYYHSREITVSGWAHRYPPAGLEPTEIWTVTDRVTFDPSLSLGVCLAHRYPSEAARPVEGEIRGITSRIVRALELRGVPIYFQMLIGGKGVRVNEIACRLGGAYEDRSIPLVTGVDILGVQLNWYAEALGIGNSESAGPMSARLARAFAVPLMFARPGTIARMSGADELGRVEGVTECRFLLPPGTRIDHMTNSTQRVAYAVVCGDDAGTINRLVDTVFDTLRVENRKGRNLLIDTRQETKRTIEVE
ncbi:MAG: hypothetical protein ACLFPW_10855 [Spirochaetaceae bacterium]